MADFSCVLRGGIFVLGTVTPGPRPTKKTDVPLGIEWPMIVVSTMASRTVYGRTWAILRVSSIVASRYGTLFFEHFFK